jgi:AAHS family 4-hydroxybenzoate transporter-like MFS transporter
MTAHVDTIRELLVLRFLTGLMLGGVMPNAVSLVTEYAPRHRRALAGTITVCGFSAGAALGGILAGLILGSFSWRAVFYVGGIGPLIVAAFVIVWLPESARFLVLAGAQPARIAKLLRQVDPGRSFGADDRFLLAEERQHGFAVSQLFHGGRALPTLLLWLAFFMNNVVLYGLTNWLPIVLRDDGVPVSQAVTITAMFQVGGTIGLIIIGRLCDAFAGRLVVALSFLCAAIAVALIGVIPGSVLLLGAVILAAGLFVVGGQGGTITIAGALYPTAIRSTGIGWGLGAARLGGVFGPLLGPMLLAQNWGTPMLFVTAAIPAVIASIAVVSVISRRPEADTIVTAPLAGGEA